MFLIYDLVFLIYSLIYLPYLFLTRRWYPGFGMRFGFFPKEIKKQIQAKSNIWIHAVSVGEVMVLDGIMQLLRKQCPADQLVVTVTTKTGLALARERLKERAVVVPSPIDFSFVAGAFGSLINPKIYIAVETEIWPNLYRQLYLKKVPLAVVNGRISDASFGRYKAIRFLLQRILNQVSVWCMQSQSDAQRIIELGAQSSCVAVTGNLKFDDAQKPSDIFYGDPVNFNDGFWWVAGSTHPGEEPIVLDVYSRIIKDDPRWRLVIAPRHIERSAQIIEMIERRGFKALRISRLSQDSPGPDTIIVVDTIGQLRSLYAGASLVFVGKSLCASGGQNVIEPAVYGKAIVIGPGCDNFRDIVSCFRKAQAIVQVQDAKTFEEAVRDLCFHPAKREALGAAAKKVVAQQQGACQRSVECLKEFLK